LLFFRLFLPVFLKLLGLYFSIVEMILNELLFEGLNLPKQSVSLNIKIFFFSVEFASFPCSPQFLFIPQSRFFVQWIFLAPIMTPNLYPPHLWACFSHISFRVSLLSLGCQELTHLLYCMCHSHCPHSDHFILQNIIIESFVALCVQSLNFFRSFLSHV